MLYTFIGFDKSEAIWSLAAFGLIRNSVEVKQYTVTVTDCILKCISYSMIVLYSSATSLHETRTVLLWFIEAQAPE